MLIDFLRKNLLGQDFFSSEDKRSISADLDRLSDFRTPDELTDDHSRDEQLPYVEDDRYDRLIIHVVQYCRHLPHAIPRQPDAKQYR